MTKENEKKNEKLNKIGNFIMVLACGFGLGVGAKTIDEKYIAAPHRAQLHVRSPYYTNKNCNDCHMWTDWAELLNRPGIKNDNVIMNIILTNAKIRMR